MHINGYESYFNGLLDIVRDKPVTNELGKIISDYSISFLDKWNRADFDLYDENYVRNYIGKHNKSGWEALVLSWKKNNITAIHGHPHFAAYTFLSGEMQLEVFDYDNNFNCVKVSETVVKPGDSFFSIGSKNKFDNCIHRISCLSDNAHSLHIYSDNALRGIIFDSTKM